MYWLFEIATYDRSVEKIFLCNFTTWMLLFLYLRCLTVKTFGGEKNQKTPKQFNFYAQIVYIMQYL